jgi:UDP-2-acetamido-3-amino-2,3-dideoxy-glucuronate N-acetyltransferase
MTKKKLDKFAGLKKRKDFFLHESSYVDKLSKVNANTKIWHFSHIQSGAIIGKNCVLGQNTYVSSNVEIGNNVKIQNNVSIFDGVKLKDNVFCGPGVVFTNVINPRSEVNRKSEFQETIVNQGATLGANSTILCGTEIGRYGFVAAGAVVTRDIKPFELVAGIPAKRIGWVSKFGLRMKFNNKSKTYVCKLSGLKYHLKKDNIHISEKKSSSSKKININYKDKKIRIGLLTYDIPHRKSFEVLNGLIKRGYKNIVLIVQKFKKFSKKNKPLFAHRPEQLDNLDQYKIAKKLKLEIRHIENPNCYDDIDLAMIGGAQVIDKNKIKKNFIINCHSGLIPQTRGLDSFKWAIFNKSKLGNTLHFIDEKIDLGNVICHKITKKYSNDSLKKIAKRHYENEINMLINFDKYLYNGKKFKLNKKTPTKRMPLFIEKKFIENNIKR